MHEMIPLSADRAPLDLQAEKHAFDIHYEDFQRAGTDDGWLGIAWEAWITARSTQATPAAEHTASLASASLDSVYLHNAASLFNQAARELKAAIDRGYKPKALETIQLLQDTAKRFHKILAAHPCPTCNGHGMLGEFPFGTKCIDCAKPRPVGYRSL